MNLVHASLLTALAAPFTSLVALGESSDLLRATSSSLSVENARADADNLSRMRNAAMVQRFAAAGLLVSVPNRTRHYYLRNIQSSFRYLRPWSRLFLDRLSRQFYARFGRPLRVTSLVRTVSFQETLGRRNGNAAPAHGPRRSSHLTGATVDISKNGMTAREVEWVRRVLFRLKGLGHLHAIEEFQQRAFHVMVFRSYPGYVKGLQTLLPSTSG